MKIPAGKILSCIFIAFFISQMGSGLFLIFKEFGIKGYIIYSIYWIILTVTLIEVFKNFEKVKE